jgi:hypothetical protein
MSSATGGPVKTSRAKIILIGGLVSTLASLWAPTFMSLGEVPAPDVPNLARQRARPSAVAVAVPREETRPAIHCDLNETLAVDPFQVPESMRKVEIAKSLPPIEKIHQEKKQQQRDKRRDVLSKLLSQRVSLIVETDRGPAARIGNKLVRIGDDIEGFRIEQISKDGVYLSSEPAESR